VRVVIVEDAVLLREGLVRLLAEHGDDVVASLDRADDLYECVVEHEPDVVIADVRMPPTNTDEGLRAAIDLRRRRPGTPVLVLSQYVEERYASELMAEDSTALGYLLKERVADVGEFVDALHRVAHGGTALDPEVVAQLFARRRRGDPLDELSPREQEVLALMAEGRSNAAIARELVISEGVVEKHITSIFQRLDLAPSEDEHRRVLAVVQFLQRRA
jgi:DNA-binding NarL/FixJ family response regulator